MRKTINALLFAMMLILSIAFVSATEVNVDFNVGGGDVLVDVDNTDASIGFHGIGSWTGNLNSISSGTYLDTNVLVESATGASFDFGGFQKLSGYTTDKIVFSAFSQGNTALMNTRFDNSNYVVELERVDTNKDFLSASGSSTTPLSPGYAIGWQMNVVNSEDYSSAGVSAQLLGNGAGAFDTNQWHATSIGSYGWGNPNGINAPSYPGYYTPTNTVVASGSGQFTQSAYGDNSLVFNGFTAGSGNAVLVANYDGGFSGEYGFHVN